MNATELENWLTSTRSPYALVPSGGHADICDLIFKNAPKSLLEILVKATSFRDRQFLISANCGEVETFENLLGASFDLSKQLRRRFGICDGNRVAFCAENSREAVVVLLGIIWAGAVPVLIPPKDFARIYDLATHLNCRCFICDSPPPDTWADLCRNYGIPLVFTKELKTMHSEGTDMSDAGEVAERIPGDGDGLIVFTSGSTGTPKGVVLSHRSVVTGLMNMLLGGTLATLAQATQRTGLAPRNAEQGGAYLIAPIYHASGYLQILLKLMMGGALIVGDPNRGIASTVDDIWRLKAHSIAGASPAVINEILNQAQAGRDFSSLQNLFISGYATYSSLVERLSAILPQVSISTGYGLTETNGSIALISGEALRDAPQSCGRILPTARVSIIDPGGEPCPEGVVGEIFIRGAMLMRGYLTESGISPLKTPWFRTGDAGYISERNILHVVDRVANFVSARSEMLSYSSIEQMLLQVPGVTEVAVFAIDTPTVSAEEYQSPNIFESRTDDPGRKSLGVAYVRALNAWDVHNHLCHAIQEQCALLEGEYKAIALPALPRRASGKIDYAGLRSFVGERPADCSSEGIRFPYQG